MASEDMIAKALIVIFIEPHSMTAFVSCPNCEQPVDLQARFCEHCGADLAVAAAIAAREIKKPIAPEVLVPRLGEYLIEKGIITQTHLEQALAYQRQKSENGTSLLLGQVLRELQLVDAETLDQVITEQILQLQSALRETNRQLERRVEERTRDLQRALERLTELNQLKANFIANISHELRTPLAHLKGYLDLLKENGFGALNEQQKGAVDILQRSELRLEKLIEDLISFSIASHGDLTLNITSIALDTLVERAVKGSSRKAQTTQIALRTDIEEELPHVYCDEEKIYWVITQLLDNALKFTPKGGNVVVRLSQKSPYLMLEVSDTGIGIPSDRLEEIFEPFHQLDGSATRRYGGTGLGLALCRQILVAHGSSIEVRSEAGCGAVFRFQLPIVMQLDSGSMP